MDMSKSTKRLIFTHDGSTAGYIVWNDAQDVGYPDVYALEEAWEHRDQYQSGDRCRLCTCQLVWVEGDNTRWEGEYCMTHRYLVKGCNPNHSNHIRIL